MSAPWRDKEPIKWIAETLREPKVDTMHAALNAALHEMDDLNARIAELEAALGELLPYAQKHAAALSNQYWAMSNRQALGGFCDPFLFQQACNALDAKSVEATECNSVIAHVEAVLKGRE